MSPTVGSPPERCRAVSYDPPLRMVQVKSERRNHSGSVGRCSKELGFVDKQTQAVVDLVSILKCLISQARCISSAGGINNCSDVLPRGPDAPRTVRASNGRSVGES